MNTQEPRSSDDSVFQNNLPQRQQDGGAAAYLPNLRIQRVTTPSGKPAQIIGRDPDKFAVPLAAARRQQAAPSLISPSSAANLSPSHLQPKADAPPLALRKTPEE